MGMRRNFAVKLSTEVMTKALGYGVTVWLARKLGPASFGSMQWALAAAALSAAAADFGLGNLVLRELSVAKAAERREWFLAAWALKGLLWALALLGFVAFALASSAPDAPLLLPAAVLTVALSMNDFGGAFFASFERLDLEFWVNSACKLGQALAALLALALGWGPAGILLAMAVAAWAGWLAGLTVQYREAGRLKRGRAKPGARMRRMKLLVAGLWPYGLTPAVALAYNSIDTLLLKHFSGSEAVGVYQSAYKWFDNIKFVPAAFMAAVFPAMARAAEAKDGLAKRMKALRSLLALGATASVCLIALAAYLPLLLGPAYEGVSPLLRALALAALFSFGNYALTHMVLAGRRQNALLGVALAALALNVALNLCFLPRFGALAAAWATVATEALLFLLLGLTLQGLCPPSLWAKALALALAAAACAGALAWGGSVAGLIAGPLLCLLLCKALGLLPEDEIRRLRQRLRESLR